MIKSTAGHWFYIDKASKEIKEKQSIWVWEFWPWILLQFGLITVYENLFSLEVNGSFIIYLNINSIAFEEVSPV